MKYFFNTLIVLSSLSLIRCSKSAPEAMEIIELIPNVDENSLEHPPLVSEISSIFSFAPESSGLVFSDSYIYTFNDSGNPSIFYKVNPQNGKLLQSISISNFDNKDWEDITADEDFIYLGDFGNNDGIRTDLRILKISKQQIKNDTSAVAIVTAEIIRFSYNEQTSFLSTSTHNFDCESLISMGDSLYIFTKNRGDNNTNVYKLSKEPGQYSLNKYASFQVDGLITGADYNLKTGNLALIGYQAFGHRNSFIYLFSNFAGDSFFTGEVAKKVIGNSKEDWQTEGIAFDSSDLNNLFLSCETTSFSKSKLFSIEKLKLSSKINF